MSAAEACAEDRARRAAYAFGELIVRLLLWIEENLMRCPKCGARWWREEWWYTPVGEGRARSQRGMPGASARWGAREAYKPKGPSHTGVLAGMGPTAVFGAVLVAFIMGVVLGVVLRAWWLYFVLSAASAILGAVMMAFALWWLGADFSTMRPPSLASLDALTASLALNVLLAFVVGVWVGYSKVASKVGVAQATWAPPSR